MSLAELLFANDAFHVAFNGGDLAAMTALWARRHPVTCIHPGWPLLIGRDAVIDSWQRILENPDQGAMDTYGARAVQGPAFQAVYCYERIGGRVLIATNLFVLEDDEPRLVHHQAGQCAEPPEPDPADRPQVQ